MNQNMMSDQERLDSVLTADILWEGVEDYIKTLPGDCTAQRIARRVAATGGVSARRRATSTANAGSRAASSAVAANNLAANGDSECAAAGGDTTGRSSANHHRARIQPHKRCDRLSWIVKDLGPLDACARQTARRGLDDGANDAFSSDPVRVLRGTLRPKTCCPPVVDRSLRA